MYTEESIGRVHVLRLYSLGQDIPIHTSLFVQMIRFPQGMLHPALILKPWTGHSSGLSVLAFFCDRQTFVHIANFFRWKIAHG